MTVLVFALCSAGGGSGRSAAGILSIPGGGCLHVWFNFIDDCTEQPSGFGSRVQPYAGNVAPVNAGLLCHTQGDGCTSVMF